MYHSCIYSFLPDPKSLALPDSVFAAGTSAVGDWAKLAILVMSVALVPTLGETMLRVYKKHKMNDKEMRILRFCHGFSIDRLVNMCKMSRKVGVLLLDCSSLPFPILLEIRRTGYKIFDILVFHFSTTVFYLREGVSYRI